MYEYIYRHKETSSLELKVIVENKKEAEKKLKQFGLFKQFYFLRKQNIDYKL